MRVRYEANEWDVQEDGKGEMAVMIDRAEGGASMQSGELEVMVHRRTLLDDARGVAEPINETQCGCLNCHCDGLIARGTHHILLQVDLQLVAINWHDHQAAGLGNMWKRYNTWLVLRGLLLPAILQVGAICKLICIW